MNREIKFRAFDIERKMYVPQGEIIFKDYGDTIVSVLPNCEEYIGDKVHNADPQYNRFIVEQFAGLKDKNGIEIYEGDILDCGLNRKKKVEYFQDGFWINCKEGALWSLRNEHKNSEVIGNIHENPELL